MNRIIKRFVAAVAVLAFCAISGLGAGQGSTSYRVTSDVFLQGSSPAVVGSASYSASISVGQHSIIGGTASSTSYTLESGFQATLANPSGGTGIESYEAWIARYGLSGTNAERGFDYDDDGFTNEQEYIADTDPTRDDAYFHLVTIQQGGATATVTFHSSANRVYELWFNTDLTDAQGWQKLQGPRAGVGGPDSMTHVQETPEPAGFYRLRVALPQ